MAKSFRDIPPMVQTVILALGAVVLVGLPSYYFVYPLFGQREQKQKQLEQLNKEVAQLQAIESKLADYQAQIKALTQQLETVRSIVPDEPSMDTFMKMMFSDAANAGIHLRTFVPLPQTQQKYYMEMPVKIHIDGTYWSTVNFFDRLAREQRIVSVASIDLGPPAGGGMGSYDVAPSETVGANCVVTAYYNRPVTAAAPVAPPRK